MKHEHDQWSYDIQKLGGHTHIKVRVGTPGSRGLCGTLVMGHAEAADFLERTTALMDMQKMWALCNAAVGGVGMEARSPVEAMEMILEAARQQGRDETEEP